MLSACGGSDLAASYAPRDPCAALALESAAATEFERQGIEDARDLWRGRGVTAFDPSAAPADTAATGPGTAPDPAPAASLSTAIAIQFDDAASAFHGQYDPVAERVHINRAISDRQTLAIVVAHELGHVFGLGHIAASTRVSLMNPGNLTSPPTEADQRALEALWGSCR